MCSWMHPTDRVDGVQPDRAAHRRLRDPRRQDRHARQRRDGGGGGALAQAARRQRSVPIVVDPVLRATRGIPLLEGNAKQALAPLLVDRDGGDAEPRRAGDATGRPRRARRRHHARSGAPASSSSARARCSPRAATSTGDIVDVLVDEEGDTAIRGQRIEGVTPHGTGCALSSEIACRLAFGAPLREAVIGACNRVRCASPKRAPSAAAARSSGCSRSGRASRAAAALRRAARSSRSAPSRSRHPTYSPPRNASSSHPPFTQYLRPIATSTACLCW